MNNKYEYLEINNQSFYLIGTAHISKLSVDDVIDTVNEVKPDSICVELDQERYQRLENPKQYSEQNIIKVIKDRRVNFLLVNLILASFQRRMAKKLDNQSGNEMITGIKLAKELNAELVLADRSVSLTFSRIWDQLNFFSKTKLLFSIISSIFDNQEISEQDLSNLKQADALESAINEVGKEFPIIKEVLIDERDKFLAYKIKNVQGKKVVAILGAAHIPGVIKYLHQDYEIDDINCKINKGPLNQILKWIIPISIIILIIVLFINDPKLGSHQIKNWILINGGLSAFGVLIARGHLLSIITAFFVAPITTIHPLLAAGWFAGIVEAMVRKPKVSDFENLANDTDNFKGFFKNNVTRILLVVIMANVFASIGTFISGFDLVKNFLNLF